MSLTRQTVGPQQFGTPTGRLFRGRAFRLLLAVGAGIGLSILFASSALAGTARAQPTISPTKSTFHIPAGTDSLWRLRLWSQGTLEGSTTGTSGVLIVVVPHTDTCSFQADVTTTPAGGDSSSLAQGDWSFYSGMRATLTSCGGAPPTQTIAGDIFLCTANGSPTTTEVTGGTLAATGPQTVTAQANPLAPTSVADGGYTMTAVAPDGYDLVVCGGTATIGVDGQTASEPVTVPSGGTGVGLFYVAAPAALGGGGSSTPQTPVPGVTSSSNNSADSTAPVPVATAAGDSPPVAPLPTTSSQLAFTGIDPITPLLIGLLLLAIGSLLITVSGIRRSTGSAVRVRGAETERSAE
jgi:hypothetical protein